MKYGTFIERLSFKFFFYYFWKIPGKTLVTELIFSIVIIFQYALCRK